MTDWICQDCNAGNAASSPHCATCGVIRAVAPNPGTWATERLEQWRSAFKTLDRTKPPEGVPINRWRRFLNDCAIFINNGQCLKAIEGGWDEYELRLLGARGFAAVSLGPRTLRSDTACVALLAAVRALR